MKPLLSGIIAVALLSGGTAAVARPDDHHHGRPNGPAHPGWGNDRGAAHRWNRGERMGYNDWNGAQRVDYRRYRLRPPPRGYEWRRQNDQFILVATATGLIASIIAATR